MDLEPVTHIPTPILLATFGRMGRSVGRSNYKVQRRGKTDLELELKSDHNSASNNTTSVPIGGMNEAGNSRAELTVYLISEEELVGTLFTDKDCFASFSFEKPTPGANCPIRVFDKSESSAMSKSASPSMTEFSPSSTTSPSTPRSSNIMASSSKAWCKA